MNWLHLSQTSSVRNTSDGGDPRLERVPGRSEQGKPWPGSPTWAAVISMDRSRGLADDYVTTKLNLQSIKSQWERRWVGGHLQRSMEMTAAHVGDPGQGFPCSLLPGTLSSRGPLPSLVFRTEDVWLRCNQFIETAEFLIRVSPFHSYNAGRAGLGWMSG